MPFIKHLEPIANVDPLMNVDQPPNAWFQLSMAISLKRIADALEAGGARSNLAEAIADLPAQIAREDKASETITPRHRV